MDACKSSNPAYSTPIQYDKISLQDQFSIQKATVVSVEGQNIEDVEPLSAQEFTSLDEHG